MTRRRLPHTPEPAHRWVIENGLRIAGDTWGPDDGPVVVLLHGGGQTRHAWKGTGRRLAAEGYRAVALDARGHGDSEWAPDGDYDSEALVDDLVEIVDQLGDPHPVLVGASLGGTTALVAAGEGRVEARALVLVDIAPRIELEGVVKIRDFMRGRPEGFTSLDEVADAIAGYQPHRERPSDLSGLAKNVRLGPDGRYHWHWDPAFMARVREPDGRLEHLESCAQALDVPTLLVRGGLSDIVSEEGVRQFLALVPEAEYVNVTGASHMVAGDRNDVFGAAVVEFLHRVAPPGGP